LSIAGMELSPLVQELKSDMPSSGGLRPGDVIISSHIDGSSDATYANGLAIDEFIDLATLAHAQSKKVDALVLRKGATGGPVAISGLDPKVALPDNKYGFGIGVGVDETLPRVAGVAPGSPAAEAEIPRGATITNVDGVAIYNWFQVRNALTVPGEHLLNFTMPNGEERSANMTLSAAAAGDIAALTLISDLVREGELRPLTEPRKTSNPLIAAAWGVTETRDLILQFYATLTRMAEGSVPAGSMMGPLGIIGAGAGFAERGIDWLIWFLALISANLAVVNFLPIITIADGGLFMFLVVEKVRGRPLAARTQAAFQFFGLVLIISVFLMVTYHDILRMLHPLR